MITRIRPSFLISLIIVWSIAGFQLVAGLANILGISSTGWVFSFRAFIALVSGLLVLEGLIRRRLHFGIGTFLFFAFWAAYSMRLVHGTIIDPQPLGRPAFIYWSFGIGACLVPAWAVALHGNSIKSGVLSLWLVSLSTIFLLIAYFAGSTVVQSETGRVYDTGRLMLESINPIKVGHTAATLVLCVHWLIRFSRPSKPRILALLALTLFAGLMLFESGSRGPLVAMLIGMIFLEALKGGWSLLFMIMLGVVVSPFLVFDMSALDHLLGVSFFSRLDAALTFADASSRMRLAQLSGAWQLFLDNPLLGGALEDPTFRIYPHNIIVEAFMATGIFGGLLLLVLCVWALLKAFAEALLSPESALVGALFVQYLLAAQFSSSIWGAYPFWVLCGFVVALNKGRLSQKRKVADGPHFSNRVVTNGVPS